MERIPDELSPGVVQLKAFPGEFKKIFLRFVFLIFPFHNGLQKISEQSRNADLFPGGENPGFFRKFFVNCDRNVLSHRIFLLNKHENHFTRISCYASRHSSGPPGFTPDCGKALDGQFAGRARKQIFLGPGGFACALFPDSGHGKWMTGE